MTTDSHATSPDSAELHLENSPTVRSGADLATLIAEQTEMIAEGVALLRALVGTAQALLAPTGAEPDDLTSPDALVPCPADVSVHIGCPVCAGAGRVPTKVAASWHSPT